MVLLLIVFLMELVAAASVYLHVEHIVSCVLSSLEYYISLHCLLFLMTMSILDVVIASSVATRSHHHDLFSLIVEFGVVKKISAVF